jgi:hypothetical protein
VELRNKYLTNITVSESSLVGVIHTRNSSHVYNKIFTINFEKLANSFGKLSKRDGKFKAEE